jgi:hypothetical protein
MKKKLRYPAFGASAEGGGVGVVSTGGGGLLVLTTAAAFTGGVVVVSSDVLDLQSGGLLTLRIPHSTGLRHFPLRCRGLLSLVPPLVLFVLVPISVVHLRWHWLSPLALFVPVLLVLVPLALFVPVPLALFMHVQLALFVPLPIGVVCPCWCLSPRWRCHPPVGVVQGWWWCRVGGKLI